VAEYPLSSCHATRLLLKRFISMRILQLTVNISAEQKPKKRTETSAFGSKTMGAAVLADRYQPKKKTEGMKKTAN